MTRPSLRPFAIAAAGLAALYVAGAAPAAAQSVRDVAVQNCLAVANNRAGGGVRVTRVSSGRTPIVKMRAPGNTEFTCMTNAQGEAVRVRRSSGSGL